MHSPHLESHYVRSFLDASAGCKEDSMYCDSSEATKAASSTKSSKETKPRVLCWQNNIIHHRLNRGHSPSAENDSLGLLYIQRGVSAHRTHVICPTDPEAHCGCGASTLDHLHTTAVGRQHHQ